MDDRRDADPASPQTPGVLAPPPLIFVAALALGLRLGREPDSEAPGAATARTVGLASIVASIALGFASALTIKRAGSNVNPYAPATALVTGGPFAVSRNPMYVGMTALYIGIALRQRSVPAFVLLPIALALLDRLVVDREERYLAARFGDVYSAYCARVPRWF